MPNVHKYFLESAQAYPERIALSSDERSLTYCELVLRINGLAERLIVEGLQRGDRVLLLLQDNIDLIVSLYAVIRAGGIAVPVAESFTAEAVDDIANDCQPFAVVSQRKQLPAYQALRDQLACRFLFIEEIASSADDGTGAIGDMKDESGGGVDRTSESMNLTVSDGAVLQYDWSSRDDLRGRLLTHQNLLHFMFHSEDGINSGMDHCELMLLPPSDIIALTRIQRLLYAGGTAVVSSAVLTPVTLIQQILDHECDAVTADTGHLLPLIEKTEGLLLHLGRQIRTLELSGGSPSIQQKRKLIELFPNARIRVHYGTVEAPQSATLELRHDRRKFDTVGHPSSRVEISIRDEAGKILRKGQPGEIFVLGDHVMAGYWRHDHLPRQVIPNEGWFRAGDIGYLDREGYLHFLGSAKDLIHAAGVTISPIEVEEKIREAYPGYEICVVGIPDPTGASGELPVLCYIGRNGRTIIPSELSSALANRLDKNKIPRIVYRVDQFPDSNHHDLRAKLKQRILDGISSSVHNLIDR